MLRKRTRSPWSWSEIGPVVSARQFDEGGITVFPHRIDDLGRRTGRADQRRFRQHQPAAVEADRTGRELYVNFARPSLARKNCPELLEMAERKDLFEPVGTLYGFEPRGLMRVYRYRGRP